MVRIFFYYQKHKHSHLSVSFFVAFWPKLCFSYIITTAARHQQHHGIDILSRLVPDCLHATTCHKVIHVVGVKELWKNKETVGSHSTFCSLTQSLLFKNPNKQAGILNMLQHYQVIRVFFIQDWCKNTNTRPLGWTKAALFWQPEHQRAADRNAKTQKSEDK